MKLTRIFFALFVISLVALLNSCQNCPDEDEDENEVVVSKRIGMVIGVKEDKLEAYRQLHADSNPGVRDLLAKYNMHNFSIFIKQFDNGKWYLFGYWEYTGTDYEKDMATLAKEQRNIDWLKVTDPMQIPFQGESSWSQLERVYYNK